MKSLVVLFVSFVAVLVLQLLTAVTRAQVEREVPVAPAQVEIEGLPDLAGQHDDFAGLTGIGGGAVCPHVVERQGRAFEGVGQESQMKSTVSGILNRNLEVN